MKRKRSPLEVGASLGVSNEQDTWWFLRSEGPRTQPSPHLCSAGRPEGSATLWVPSNEGLGERGDVDQDWDSSSHFALATCFGLRPDIISHFQKVPWRWQKRPVAMLSFRLPVTSGCSGQKTLPRTRPWRRRPGRAQPPGQSSHSIFLYQVISAQSR